MYFFNENMHMRCIIIVIGCTILFPQVLAQIRLVFLMYFFNENMHMRCIIIFMGCTILSLKFCVRLDCKFF
jgi:hypothetical protein